MQKVIGITLWLHSVRLG